MPGAGFAVWMGGGSSFRSATFSSGLAGVASSAPAVVDIDIGGGGAGVPFGVALSSVADVVALEAVGFGGIFSLLGAASSVATPSVSTYLAVVE